jgi:hypothetical protein
VLFAYDTRHLGTLYTSDATAGSANTAGSAVKFSVPPAANGKVYVGTQTEITVFGLLPQGISALPEGRRTIQVDHPHYLSGGFSHAFVVGAAAAFGDFPIDNLVGICDVAGFAVDAVGGVDF